MGGLAWRRSGLLVKLESRGGWLKHEFDDAPKSVEMRCPGNFSQPVSNSVIFHLQEANWRISKSLLLFWVTLVNSLARSTVNVESGEIASGQKRKKGPSLIDAYAE